MGKAELLEMRATSSRNQILLGEGRGTEERSLGHPTHQMAKASRDKSLLETRENLFHSD
jgi:hypothetical protein